ncbi:MAG: hypothetical protein CMQ19_01690 [Gammaproteobacteria bacterium]|jgi:hypothetical protein|nr:hypothetical protein [Gammaproteobacteria bacterium]|tara:strand:+ start:2973 stop:3518 length:546 start_codon:yes stop_codon:yes gene_type:complete
MAQVPIQPNAPGIMPSPQADPLAALRDIHLPLPIETWPPAPGWWVMAFLGIAAILAMLYWLWHRWQANAYRRDGIKQLDAILKEYESHGDISRYLMEYQVLLKRVALTRYDRDLVASLSGEAWVAFLDKSSNCEEFTIGEGQALIDSNYRLEPAANIDKLSELGRLWIRKHRDLPIVEQAA